MKIDSAIPGWYLSVDPRLVIKIEQIHLLRSMGDDSGGLPTLQKDALRLFAGRHVWALPRLRYG